MSWKVEGIERRRSEFVMTALLYPKLIPRAFAETADS